MKNIRYVDGLEIADAVENYLQGVRGKGSLIISHEHNEVMVFEECMTDSIKKHVSIPNITVNIQRVFSGVLVTFY